MRIPGRVHITWQDDNTLKVEKDSGTQTRLFHFGATGQNSPVAIGKAFRRVMGRRGWRAWPLPGNGLKVVTRNSKLDTCARTGCPTARTRS